jgi:hypothetical protein
MEGGTPRQPAPQPPAHEGAAAAADAAADDGEKGGDKGDGFDMFNDDVVEEAVVEDALDEAAAMDRGDNYDDKEGYYAHRIGDMLADRYKARPAAAAHRVPHRARAPRHATRGLTPLLPLADPRQLRQGRLLDRGALPGPARAARPVC